MACSAPSGDVIVAVLETEHDAVAYHSRLSEAGGSFAAPVLRNDGPLPNEALPENTADLGGGFLTISQFDDSSAQQDFIDQEAIQATTSFLATGRTINWFPFIGRPLPLAALEPVQSPSFTLVNLIDQRSLANPNNGIRMFRYMSSTTPLLRGNGVEFVTPVMFENILRGANKPDLLFLTNWPDQETFEAIHSDPAFVSSAQTNRNQVFQGFTETRTSPVSLHVED